MRHLVYAPFLLLLVSAAHADPGAAAALPDRRPTVAVLYFDFEGHDPELNQLRKGFAQMLISDLAGIESVRVIERTRLQDVLSELELARTAQLDASSVARVGKLLGAQLLVLGSYFTVMGRLRFDARLVETETGRVIASVGAHGKPEDVMELEARLATQLQGGLQQAVRQITAQPASDPAPARRRSSPPRPKVSQRAVAAYGRALDAVDRKDVATARKELESAVAASPGFSLASVDLSRLAL